MSRDAAESTSRDRGESTPALLSRRRFGKTVAVGGLAWTAVGFVAQGGITSAAPRFGKILVDYAKCTGCRTCETVCAQYNHRTRIDGRELWGLGNPRLSNIRVEHFNPDVDVPVVCTMCEDAPCIEACPVAPDAEGRRALFRDPRTMAIRSDPKRCVGCGRCAKACLEKRVGAIIPDPESGCPERMCTLCDGDPQCVKHCPYGALTYEIEGTARDPEPASAEDTARKLMDRWYDVRGSGGDDQP